MTMRNGEKIKPNQDEHQWFLFGHKLLQLE